MPVPERAANSKSAVLLVGQDGSALEDKHIRNHFFENSVCRFVDASFKCKVFWWEYRRLY